jgi:hypothetical protein
MPRKNCRDKYVIESRSELENNYRWEVIAETSRLAWAKEQARRTSKDEFRAVRVVYYHGDRPKVVYQVRPYQKTMIRIEIDILTGRY